MTQAKAVNQSILLMIAMLQKRGKDGELEDFCDFLEVMAKARRDGVARERIENICMSKISTYRH